MLRDFIVATPLRYDISSDGVRSVIDLRTVWASAGVDEILSALYEKLTVKA